MLNAQKHKEESAVLERAHSEERAGGRAWHNEGVKCVTKFPL